MIIPRHPTVVRGFSKYTRMITNISCCTRIARSARRPAYSSAALSSWMEQGPTITSRRGSRPARMSITVSRARTTVSLAAGRIGNSCFSARGVVRGSIA